MTSKWVFLFLGALLGVVVREVGSWAPGWAERLIARRGRKLDRADEQAFVTASTSKLSTIPGDWAKLIYTALRLRTQQPKPDGPARTWTWPYRSRLVDPPCRHAPGTRWWRRDCSRYVNRFECCLVRRITRRNFLGCDDLRLRPNHVFGAVVTTKQAQATSSSQARQAFTPSVASVDHHYCAGRRIRASTALVGLQSPGGELHRVVT